MFNGHGLSFPFMLSLRGGVVPPWQSSLLKPEIASLGLDTPLSGHSTSARNDNYL